MKYLITLMLLLPLNFFRGNYIYTRVSASSTGSNNFNVSEYKISEQSGIIKLQGRYLKIDDKKYRLRSTRKKNVYRIKGGVALFVYDADRLVSIQLYQYNLSRKYTIENSSIALDK